LEAQVLEVRRLSHYTSDLSKDLDSAKHQSADAKAKLDKMVIERDGLSKANKELNESNTDLRKRLANQEQFAAEFEKQMRLVQDRERELKEKFNSIQDAHDKAFSSMREDFNNKLEEAVQHKVAVVKQAQSLQKDVAKKAAEATRLKDELARKTRSLEDAMLVLKEYVDADASKAQNQKKGKKATPDTIQRSNEDLKALSVKMTQQIQEKDAEITRLTSENWSMGRQIAALEQKLSMKSRSSSVTSQDKSKDSKKEGDLHSMLMKTTDSLGSLSSKRSATPDTPNLEQNGQSSHLNGLGTMKASASSSSLSSHKEPNFDKPGNEGSAPPSPHNGHDNNRSVSFANDSDAESFSPIKDNHAPNKHDTSVLSSSHSPMLTSQTLTTSANTAQISSPIQSPSPMLKPALPKLTVTQPVSNTGIKLAPPAKRPRADSVDIHFDL
jgi:predicted  nucleic acid-binding Zn-ribbon protein